MNETKTSLLSQPPGDKFTIRCSRLGHQINFSYCRSENHGLPCFKTLDCWYTHFDVQAFLGDQLTQTDFKNLVQNKIPSKILSLLDLIEQAKQSKEESS